MGRSKHYLIRTTDSEISISLLNEKGEEIETADSRPTEEETQVHPTSPQRTHEPAPCLPPSPPPSVHLSRLDDRPLFSRRTRPRLKPPYASVVHTRGGRARARVEMLGKDSNERTNSLRRPRCDSGRKARQPHSTRTDTYSPPVFGSG